MIRYRKSLNESLEGLDPKLKQMIPDAYCEGVLKAFKKEGEVRFNQSLNYLYQSIERLMADCKKYETKPSKRFTDSLERLLKTAGRNPETFPGRFDGTVWAETMDSFPEIDISTEPDKWGISQLNYLQGEVDDCCKEPKKYLGLRKFRELVSNVFDYIKSLQ